MWTHFTLVLIVTALAGLWVQLCAAEVVLRLHGARRLHFEEAPRVHRLVARLSCAAGTPMPLLYVLPLAWPNAFSLGTRRWHASLVLTEGALRELDEATLAALAAHELAHIAQGHTRRATLAEAVAAVLERVTAPARTGGAGALRTLIERLHGPRMLSERDLRADRFAARLLGGPQELIELLARLQARRDATALTEEAGLGAPFTAFFSWHGDGAALDARLGALRRLAEEEHARRQSGIWLRQPVRRRGSRFLRRSRDVRPRPLMHDGLRGRREGSAG